MAVASGRRTGNARPKAASPEDTMSTVKESVPDQHLIKWLKSAHVDHEIREHATAFTARDTARAEGVDAGSFANSRPAWVRS
jgi:hypothetical protein